MTTAEFPTRITWRTQGWTAQVGRVGKVDLFTIEHPGHWSLHFTLSSPLIPCGHRSGPVGTVEFPYLPGPSVKGKAASSTIRAAFAAERERYRVAQVEVQAFAEELLREFARSILGVDAPTQDG